MKVFDWNLPKQTVLRSEKRVGDCWRCCVAAILQLPATSLPHFAELAEGGFNGSYMADTQRWLNEKGFCLLGCDNGFIFYKHGCDNVDVPFISVGPTSRSIGLGKQHAVISFRGDFVYDPHPDNTGLTAIVRQYVILPLL